MKRLFHDQVGQVEAVIFFLHDTSPSLLCLEQFSCAVNWLDLCILLHVRPYLLLTLLIFLQHTNKNLVSNLIQKPREFYSLSTHRDWCPVILAVRNFSSCCTNRGSLLIYLRKTIGISSKLILDGRFAQEIFTQVREHSFASFGKKHTRTSHSQLAVVVEISSYLCFSEFNINQASRFTLSRKSLFGAPCVIEFSDVNPERFGVISADGWELQSSDSLYPSLGFSVMQVETVGAKERQL